MSMIEVDPKLFVTCRLCLEEMGQYQIVPQVQIQIKYCFEIEVQPFDGLPQLICKKCESILSQYAEIKKKFQEKQRGLRKNIKENNTPIVPSTNQQQDTVSSTQQVDSEFNNQISKTKEKDNKIFISTSRNSSLDREPAKDNRKLLGVNKNVAKRSKTVWKNDYEKNFVCRFCAKSLKKKKSIVDHLKQCHLLRNYSNVIRRCVITMNKIDSIPNLTFSNENVVHGRDKVINSQLKNYYVLYTKKINVVKSMSSDSSDEDFSIPRKKRKRLRLFSRSSNETLVIENNNTSPSFVKSDRKDKNQKDTNRNEKESTDVSDIELINIDDSDSASTASRTTLNKAEPIQDETPQESTIENDKVIQNIVNMCYNKYLKRLNMGGKNSKDTENDESFLQRKILSMGRKVIHKKGLISTGLIRYMEHKDLNVDWIPKCTANVTIKTTLKDNSNNESNELNWKCVKDIDNTYTDEDFIDIFETMNKVRNVEQCSQTKDVTEIENNVTLDLNDGAHLSKQSSYDDSAKLTSSSLALVVPYDKNIYERKVENSVLFIRTTPESEKQTMLKKLLNANPVANPKKLPKKATPVELLTLLTNSSTPSKTDTSPNTEDSNNMSGGHMPIITSTMSLATLNEEENNKESNNESVNKPESETNKSHLTLPRIKVKSVADLMPENTVPKSFIVPSNSWTSCLYNDDQNRLVQNKNPPMVYNVTNNKASYTNINSQCPNRNSYSQYHLNKSADKSTLLPNSNESSRNKEQYVTMHTVELPNTKTNSPFRYLQQLLQIHNIVLLSNADVISSNMSCLIKFKLVFHQESSVAVTLCLSFYCKQNTFCIRVLDINSKHIDIVKLSAYWQWEILKEFKGNVVPKLYENASKISPDILQQTYHFVRFLNSIEFSK